MDRNPHASLEGIRLSVPGFPSTSLWHPYIFTKDWDDILRCSGVGVSFATPLFYSNRMITHCLEARGRYIIKFPNVSKLVQMTPLFCLQLYPVKKKEKNRIQRREKRNQKRVACRSRYLLELIPCVSDRYSQGKAYTFILCKKWGQERFSQTWLVKLLNEWNWLLN